jgi:hypothetical protein
MQMDKDIGKYAEGEGLAKLYYKTFPSRNRKVPPEELQFWRQAKALYMSSENWKRLRQQRLIHGCNTYASDIHHISYAHIGDEALWDLRAVCRQCHKKVSRG